MEINATLIEWEFIGVVLKFAKRNCLKKCLYVVIYATYTCRKEKLVFCLEAFFLKYIINIYVIRNLVPNI